MRTLFTAVFLLIAFSIKAQLLAPVSIMDYGHRAAFNNLRNDSSKVNKKWFFNTYTGLTTGLSFFKGGSASFIAIPVGIQLNRKLTDNWYAFAGLTAAPSYINFNGSYAMPAGKAWSNTNFLRTNKLGIYSRAELGLMYVNEAKTFSISGSIGVEKSSYPLVPYYPGNTLSPAATLPQTRW